MTTPAPIVQTTMFIRTDDLAVLVDKLGANHPLTVRAADFLATAENGLHQSFRDAARTAYASDDIEIDPHAAVSVGEGGAFVAAWVHVTDAEAGIEDSDDEEGEK